MKNILLLLAGFFLCLIAGATLAADKAAQPARPTAVLFHADWCYNCKVLIPKYTDAKQGLDGEISFVEFDLTDDGKFAIAQKKAVKLGLSGMLLGHIATGWVALLDAKGRKVAEIHQDMSADAMHKLLVKLAAGG